jgi:hypothetical protein
MKQATLLFTLASVMLALSLSAQDIDVPETNQPLITKRTASWCPKCGGYGWELFRNLLEDNSENALILAAHYGGSAYENPASTDLVAELGGFGQPIFFVNTSDLGVNSGNIDQKRQEAATQVMQINDELPVAQTGLLAYPEAGTESLLIQTKTRFFQEYAEEVSLAIYIIQPTFIGSQSGQGGNAEHKNMLRLAIDGRVFGESLGEVFPEGTEVEREFSVSYADLQASGFDDLSELGSGQLIVAAVLWTGMSGDRSVLNTNHVNETMLTAVQSPEALSSFELFPSPASELATVQLELEQPWLGVGLQLVDAQGRVLQQLFQGTLQSGEHTFAIDRNNLPAGQYWLRLSDGRRTAVRALLFK